MAEEQHVEDFDVLVNQVYSFKYGGQTYVSRPLTVAQHSTYSNALLEAGKKQEAGERPDPNEYEVLYVSLTTTCNGEAVPTEVIKTWLKPMVKRIKAQVERLTRAFEGETDLKNSSGATEES